MDYIFNISRYKYIFIIIYNIIIVIITFQLLTSLLLKVPLNRKTIVTAHILLSIYSPYIEISYVPYITIAIALLASKLTDCPKSLKTVYKYIIFLFYLIFYY